MVEPDVKVTVSVSSIHHICQKIIDISKYT